MEVMLLESVPTPSEQDAWKTVVAEKARQPLSNRKAYDLDRWFQHNCYYLEMPHKGDGRLAEARMAPA